MDFPLPPLGEGLFEVELVRWLVRPGDAVSRGQGLAEVMSDKASMEVPAPFAGTITTLAASPGTKVKVGDVFLSYDAIGELTKPPRNVQPLSTQTIPITMAAQPGQPLLMRPEAINGHVVAPTRGSLPPAAPSVRMLARKFNIDLGKIRGSGPGGRILVDDLAGFLRPKSAGVDSPVAGPSKTDTSRLDFGVAGTRQKLVGLRRKTAEHMVEAKHKIPHYSYIDECDLTDLVRLRNQLREPLAANGIKLTYLAFFIKAVARALKEIPVVNSTYDEPAGEVVLHDRYNIGFAVAAPNGLIVPIIRDADRKDVPTIAAEIDHLGNDAKAGKSKIEDLRGGTFTVTSVGGIGGLISTPIINHPEVGILGLGKVVKRPVYDANGNLKPADIVFLSFSFDHRIVDGAVGAAFSNAVLRYLQAPATLLLPERASG